MACARAEEARVGGAPVGEEKRAGRVPVLEEEAFEHGRDVPRSRREVYERGVLTVVAAKLLVENGHSGNDAAGGLGDHEGVPPGDEGAGQERDEDRVVDVADNRDFLRLIIENVDVRRDGVCAIGAEGELVDAGGELYGNDLVDNAGAVSVRLKDLWALGGAHSDRDSNVRVDL